MGAVTCHESTEHEGAHELHLAVQVLHIRGFSGAGLTFLALVVACFSMFNVECRSLEVALAMTPDLRLQHVFTNAHPGVAPAIRRSWKLCMPPGSTAAWHAQEENTVSSLEWDTFSK